MPEEEDGKDPSGDATDQPNPQSYVTPPTPQEKEMGEARDDTPDKDNQSAKELKREFRIVEFVSIATNLVIAIVGSIALIIYGIEAHEAITARKTQVSIQRPYMLPFRISLYQGNDLLVHWDNFGETPSKAVHYKLTWQKDLPKNYRSVIYKKQLDSLSIPPHHNLEIPGDLILTDDEMDEMQTWPHLYVLTRVTYGDFFPSDEGGSITHIVETCNEYTNLSVGGKLSIVAGAPGTTCQGAMLACIDEDCGQDYKDLNPQPPRSLWWKFRHYWY